MNSDFTIIIDTREQQPYQFPGVETIRGTLKTGDYSILGYEDEVCVERKSIADLVSTLDGAKRKIKGEWKKSNRERFREECERMRSFRFYALVVDGSRSEIEAHLKKVYKTKYTNYLKQKKICTAMGKKPPRPPRHPKSSLPGITGSIAALRTDYNLPTDFTGSREGSAALILEFFKYYTRETASNPNRRVKS